VFMDLVRVVYGRQQTGALSKAVMNVRFPVRGISCGGFSRNSRLYSFSSLLRHLDVV
jgi:hypothetical protein